MWVRGSTSAPKVGFTGDLYGTNPTQQKCQAERTRSWWCHRDMHLHLPLPWQNCSVSWSQVGGVSGIPLWKFRALWRTGTCKDTGRKKELCNGSYKAVDGQNSEVLRLFWRTASVCTEPGRNPWGPTLEDKCEVLLQMNKAIGWKIECLQLIIFSNWPALRMAEEYSSNKLFMTPFHWSANQLATNLSPIIHPARAG